MLTLIAILFVCHFLADFTHLSTLWMLKAKARGTPLFPIFCHGVMHFLLMSLCTSLYFCIINFPGNAHKLTMFAIAMSLQLISHTIIDVCKGLISRYEYFSNNTQRPYWILMGFDQLCHQLIILLMVYILYS